MDQAEGVGGEEVGVSTGHSEGDVGKVLNVSEETGDHPICHVHLEEKEKEVDRGGSGGGGGGGGTSCLDKPWRTPVLHPTLAISRREENDQGEPERVTG